MKEKVEEALAQIRPTLEADGGGVELVDVSEGIVKLRLTGVCRTCPMAGITLREHVERLLKEKVPEIKEIIAV